MSEKELDSSKLGTLEYWEEAYEVEIANFNDFGDEGEIWFGAQSVKRVINWLKTKEIDINSEIIDIGTGNGFTCFKLAESGYTHLLGVDYSKKSVELSKTICEKENLNIEFQVMDVLDRSQYPSKKFDIGIDKGTYDAIALCPNNSKEKRHQYKDFLCNILKPSGLFIITSCNWTSTELIDFFTKENEFEFNDEIKSPAQFSFGGVTGSTTVQLIFKFIK